MWWLAIIVGIFFFVLMLSLGYVSADAERRQERLRAAYFTANPTYSPDDPVEREIDALIDSLDYK